MNKTNRCLTARQSIVTFLILTMLMAFMPMLTNEKAYAEENNTPDTAELILLNQAKTFRFYQTDSTDLESDYSNVTDHYYYFIPTETCSYSISVTGGKPFETYIEADTSNEEMLAIAKSTTNNGTVNLNVRLTKGQRYVVVTSCFPNEKESFNCTTKIVKNIVPIGSMALSTEEYMYNGSVKTPSAVLRGTDNSLMAAGTDYTVAYASGRKYPGTYAVTATAKGNYSGKMTKSFTITPATIASARLSYTSYTYNGRVKTPAMYLTGANKLSMRNGTDYTVKYASGRKMAGRYPVTATSKGNYTGKITKYFYIYPKKPAVRSLVGGRKKFTIGMYYLPSSYGAKYYHIGFREVNGSKWSYSYTGSKAKSYSGLRSGRYYYVRVRGYGNVDGTRVFGPWSTLKKIKVK